MEPATQGSGCGLKPTRERQLEHTLASECEAKRMRAADFRYVVSDVLLLSSNRTLCIRAGFRDRRRVGAIAHVGLGDGLGDGGGRVVLEGDAPRRLGRRVARERRLRAAQKERNEPIVEVGKGPEKQLFMGDGQWAASSGDVAETKFQRVMGRKREGRVISDQRLWLGKFGLGECGMRQAF
eukprot:922331-Pleurochrysis_carterae.AAC.3